MEKLHAHPVMEGRLGVDDDHVIIDRSTYDRLLKREQEEAQRGVSIATNRVVLTVDRNEARYEVFLGDQKSSSRLVRFTNAQSTHKEHLNAKIVPNKLREEIESSFHSFNLMQCLNEY